MGQVFTWNALRCGRVPCLESFTEVVDVLQRDLPGEPSITGAHVCGSVVRGEHTIRSDIDCFVIYDHTQESEAFAYLQQAAVFARQRYVPLNFVLCDTLLAGTRMHHIGTSFRGHLEKSIEAGGLLKGEPLAGIAPSLPERDELESYMRVKMYSLQTGWTKTLTFSEEERAAYLQKLLEAPIHIARKVLAHAEPLEADSKSYIQNRYREVMPRGMSFELDRLLGEDAEYTAALPDAILRPDEKTYRMILDHLLGLSEDVLKFIRANSAFVANAAR